MQKEKAGLGELSFAVGVGVVVVVVVVVVVLIVLLTSQHITIFPLSFPSLLLSSPPPLPSKAYQDMVDRFLGQERPWRFLEAQPRGMLKQFFARLGGVE